LSFEFRSMLEKIEARGAEVEEIRAIGGGAKSDLWLQMKADIVDKKIVRPEITEGGSLGAAALGGIGVGTYKDAFDAAEKVIQIKDRFEPSKERVKLYDRYYTKVYHRMRSDLTDLFDEISQL